MMEMMETDADKDELTMEYPGGGKETRRGWLAAEPR